MKKIGIIIAAACLCATSCLKSLDTKPLNETDFTSDVAYGNEEGNYISGLAKIYYCFINQWDLQVADMGSSELIRALWNINECSTDEAKSAMQMDSWVKDINENGWTTAENAATYAVYARCMHAISYVNEFLRQTAEDVLAERGVDSSLSQKIQGMRQEARIIRAYMFWVMLDTFGDVPFVTEDSEFGTYVPEQAKRADVFDYVVTELKEVTENAATPAAGSNYPRVDKGTAWGMLSRLYVNAEVYTGTNRWADAKAACEEVFKLGYDLCPEYAWLFRGDNGENPESRKEIMFAVYYDGVKSTWKWGGTNYLSIGASQKLDDENGLFCIGLRDHWASIRAPFEFARDKFSVSNQNYETGTYDCPDDRGKLFYIKGREEEMKDISVFTQGWSVFKYNNTPHDQTPEQFKDIAATRNFSSIDFPIMRLAEVYLNYAEACMHLNQKDAALPYLNKLRTRAHASTVSDYDADWLLEERSRELYWEALRRVDLIRFGKFTSGTYLWKYKGGSYNGQSIPEYRKIFAIPPSEISSNKKLVQNPGYVTGN